MPSPRRRVAVLGSTGSIGTNALDVLAAHPEAFELVGLAARSNVDLLHEQVQKFRPRWTVVADDHAMARVRPDDWCGTELLCGNDGLRFLAGHRDVEVVLVAIVGAAGLLGTLAAVEAGKTVALANKESLVMAGALVTARAAATGAKIIPVDSEHNAIFQLLQGGRHGDVERVVLTASGGPFRGWNKERLRGVSVEQALNHPTWKMGKKITIDSATLMNKALEVIEARWLFQLGPEQIGVVIHPESIVHSFVEFRDGSVLAQLSTPDMRLPIQYALTYPERWHGPARRLDWHGMRALHFENPDREAFPALQLGYEVVRRGGTCGAVLNAANEAAVERFLAGTFRFTDVAQTCATLLDRHQYRPEPTLDDLLAVDRWAREEVARCVTG